MEKSSITTDGIAPSGGLVTVVDLLFEQEAAALERSRTRLKGLETQTLCKLAYAGLQQKKRVTAFLANEELTRRGIPPCFRGLPDPNDDDAEELADLLAIDLEWIAGRYPMQKVFMGRWKSLTSSTPKQRWATIRFICKWETREMWRYVKGLAMSKNQEWECHYLHHDKIRWARVEIKRARKEVAEKLRRRRYDRNLTLATDEELADFERWLEVWSCASMGAWKLPSRVAWLYAVKTGRPLTRQMAAKIMDKLRRDLPPQYCRL